MKHSNHKWVLLLAILSLTIVSACNNNSAPQNIAPDPTPLQVEEVITEVEEPKPLPYAAPLTGQPIEEPTTIRPTTVMTNNAPAARPQSGLINADVMYEVLAEGGITRFIAVYQNGGENEQTIGPVRSIRPYLIDLGESHHGVLVHGGGSPEAYSIMKKEGKEHLDEITNAGAYFWRDKSRKAPHNLYTNLEKIRQGATKKGYDTEDTSIPAYSFRTADEVMEGADAANIDIKFLLDKYKVSYQYNPDTLLYERSINDEPHVDLNNDQQLTATNIVVLGADHKVLDDVGRLSVDIDSGGEAMLFGRGKVIEGQWIRKSDDIIRFVQSGIETPLYPGTTHILIVPNTPSFASHVTINKAN